MIYFVSLVFNLAYRSLSTSFFFLDHVNYWGTESGTAMELGTFSFLFLSLKYLISTLSIFNIKVMRPCWSEMYQWCYKTIEIKRILDIWKGHGMVMQYRHIGFFVGIGFQDMGYVPTFVLCTSYIYPVKSLDRRNWRIL